MGLTDMASSHGHGTLTQGTLSTTARKKKCMCELNWCPVCGAQRCRPRREGKWAHGTLNTTYKHDYDEKRGLGRDGPGDLANKDKTLVPSLGAFDATTTNRADYTPKKGSPWGRRDRGATFPYRPFDASTTYNNTYLGKQGPRSAAADKTWDAYSAPFLGTTTQRADYVDMGDGRRVGHKPTSSMPNLPFDGTTTYRDDFTKKKMPPRDPRQPPPLLPSNNRDNYTLYGTDYVEHPLTRSRVECCDHPHHPTQHMHGLTTTAKQMYGTATGRLYRTGR
mmetsp:Transcript_28583/g.72729  ORF Transcript_28583/g.72729 Transcript_28583/m.72729 type:complete len:278 (-) Transcript_28583:119-952(-)